MWIQSPLKVISTSVWKVIVHGHWVNDAWNWVLIHVSGYFFLRHLFPEHIIMLHASHNLTAIIIV